MNKIKVINELKEMYKEKGIEVTHNEVVYPIGGEFIMIYFNKDDKWLRIMLRPGDFNKKGILECINNEINNNNLF